MSPTKPTGTKYRAIVGMNYGEPERRVEPGDLVDDLPQKSIAWLLEQGAIETAEG